MAKGKIKVFFINNDGAGFAAELEVVEGTTASQLFAAQLPNGDPGNYTIRVNREGAGATQELKQADRMTVTPKKIQGA